MTTQNQQLALDEFVLPSDEKAQFARRFPVHVGVDTGKSFHKMVARAKSGARRQPVRVDVSRDGFEAADRYLRRSFPRVARRRTLIGIEGAGEYGLTFADFLTDKGYHVVEVPALATSRTRELDDRSPRKDDDKDAAQICGLIATGIFVRSPIVEERIAGLRLLVRERDSLLRDRRRVGNRLGQLLATAWPEFETQFGDVDSDYVRVILQAWPLPGAFAHVRSRVIRHLLHDGRSWRAQFTRIDQARLAAKTTIGLTTAPEVRGDGIRRTVTQWEFLQGQIDCIGQSLDVLVSQHAGGRALLTVPRVKLTLASTFLSALGDPANFESPREVLKLAGLNLTRRQSGTTVLTTPHISRRGRRLLRAQLFLLAGRWCRPDGLLRSEYVAMVARNGGQRKKAIVAMARKLVPLLLHIAKTGEPFDIERWNASRRTGVASR